MSVEELRELIKQRDASLDALHRQSKSVATRALLNQHRAELQCAVRRAKSRWIIAQCDGINDSISGSTGSAAAWERVKALKAGLQPPRRAAPAKMRKKDGTLATTPEENAEVHAEAFSELYGRTPEYDESVLDALPQSAVVPDLDGEPTDAEIHCALNGLHDTAPGASGLAAPLWKALGETAETFALVRQIVLSFWRSEEMPKEWEVGLLAILPKKGDLSLPKNYRGIMMLEVAYKIVARIILARLKPIKTACVRGACACHPPLRL